MNTSKNCGKDDFAEPAFMEESMALAHRMMAYEPIPWERLPDLGLYMDQVITFLERQLACLHPDCGREERVLTPAMINNYVKQCVIPRPNGKKYDREHLAALLMVCALKQVLPIDAVTQLINAPESDIRVRYEAFCTQQCNALERAGNSLLRHESTALQCALEAGAQCLAAEALLAQRMLGDQAENTKALATHKKKAETKYTDPKPDSTD